MYWSSTERHWVTLRMHAGATTNSGAGVKETDLDIVLPTLQAMAEVGLPLLCHGESTDQCSDVFDREAKWVKEV
jgi:dihydroorotase